jgi:hypothetical protein
LRAEYATFLHPSFEADGFAHAVLNGEDYPPPAEGEEPTGVPAVGFMKGLVGEGGTGDVSAALSRLNFGVEDLNRQLKAEVCPFFAYFTALHSPIPPLQVTKHHSSLLLQAASLGGLDGDLADVRRGLSEVEGGVSRSVVLVSPPLRPRNSLLIHAD